ncbi:cation channel sperm-associated protein subunit epsilon-like [Patiria miniata]|uniref:Uncharacterized protein n=1 Tax=Patiria miniata TaxID=46514 RepID=A0A913Z789_PATMI|nr:cation channel sperm-associated protein subunit epsilon-like [Patiria miniata]
MTVKAVFVLFVRVAVLMGLHMLCLGECDDTTMMPCVWRIVASKSDVEAGFIGTNTPFQVFYLDTACAQEVQWEATDGCTVKNQSSPSTIVTCCYPGYHTITPTMQQSCNQCVSVGKTVAVRNNPLCYRWYAVSVNQAPIWHDRDPRPGQWTIETLRVWVIDWTEAGDEEQNNTATTPSQYSAVFTRKFHDNGQRPTVQQVHATNQQQLQVDNVTFNEDWGCWEVLVRIPVYSELELKIMGSPDRTVFACFIGDTTVLLTNNWLSVAIQGQTAQLHHFAGYPTRVVQDPCASHVAILLSQNLLLLTEDGFLTSRNLTLPLHLAQNLSLEVQSVAFTPTHLLLLIDSNVYGLHRTMENLTLIAGLTGQSVVKGRDWCIPPTLHRSHLAVSFNTSSLFLISTMSLNDHHLFSQEITLPLSVFQLLGFMTDLTIEIHDVALDSFSDTLGIAVMVTQNSRSSLVFLQYDITLTSWTHKPFWLDARNINGSVSMQFTSGAGKASFLFWDYKRLYFSDINGQYGAFTIRGSDSTMLTTSSSDFIKQVSISPSGDIVVLLSSNRLHYSIVGQATLIDLSAIELPATLTNLIFDQLGNLFIVIVDSENNNSSILYRRWQYPLNIEVAGMLHDLQIYCPFRRFQHTDPASMYYLDIGDVVELWACLTYPSDDDIRLQVVSSSPGLLDILEEDLGAYHPGWLAVNKTLTIKSSLKLSSFTGDVVLEVGPDQEDFGCKEQGSMVAHLSVGCPPGRHIRVRKPDTCLHFSNYTIPRNAYLEFDGSAPQDIKVVDYDWSAFTCPIIAHYQQPFRPFLDLFDHDEYVAEVNTNYVVTEEQGRTDFSYNTSMLQAGCHTLAPTLITNRSEEIIATDSYLDCFILNGTKDSAALHRQRYSVLNRTGVASVIWNAERNNSIYQFTATVVDPRYSFCRLQAKFAVLVYGHPAEEQLKPVTQVSLGTFALVTFALLLTSYLYFRKGHIKKLEQQLIDYDTD